MDFLQMRRAASALAMARGTTKAGASREVHPEMHQLVIEHEDIA